MDTLRTTVVCCCLLLPSVSGADEADETPVFSASLHGGSFTGNSNSNPRFTGQDGDFALALAIQYQPAPHVAIGLDYTGYGQQFDSQMTSNQWLVGVDQEMDVTTSAVSAHVLYVAAASRAAFYAGGGVGYYKTTATVDAAAFGIFPVDPVLEESAGDMGVHALAAVALRFSESLWLDIQYRRISAQAQFGGTLGKIDVGGDTLLFGLRYCL